jgi:DNA-binding NarL/FixJ family response regulator
MPTMLLSNEHKAAQHGCSPVHALRTLCGVPGVDRSLARYFASLGLRCDDTAPTAVLFDVPYGFALRQLWREQDRSGVVVVTWNTCAEYLEDVWNLLPAALLVGVDLERELPAALMRAWQGERVQRMPPYRSTLTPLERAAFRRLAHGCCDEQIARDLHLQNKTVRNTLSSVYGKLGVKGRVEAVLYYWGQQDLLQNQGDDEVSGC